MRKDHIFFKEPKEMKIERYEIISLVLALAFMLAPLINADASSRRSTTVNVKHRLQLKLGNGFGPCSSKNYVAISLYSAKTGDLCCKIPWTGKRLDDFTCTNTAHGSKSENHLFQIHHKKTNDKTWTRRADVYYYLPESTTLIELGSACAVFLK